MHVVEAQAQRPLVEQIALARQHGRIEDGSVDGGGPVRGDVADRQLHRGCAPQEHADAVLVEMPCDQHQNVDAVGADARGDVRVACSQRRNPMVRGRLEALGYGIGPFDFRIDENLEIRGVAVREQSQHAARDRMRVEIGRDIAHAQAPVGISQVGERLRLFGRRVGGGKAPVLVAHARGRDRVEIVERVEQAAPALHAQRPFGERESRFESLERFVVARLHHQGLGEFVLRVEVPGRARQQAAPHAFGRDIAPRRHQSARKIGGDGRIVGDLAQGRFEKRDGTFGLAEHEACHAAVDEARQMHRVDRKLGREQRIRHFEIAGRHGLGRLLVMHGAHGAHTRTRKSPRASVVRESRHSRALRSTVRAA
jgi:hypothetical protein